MLTSDAQTSLVDGADSICTQSTFRDSGFGDMDSGFGSLLSTISSQDATIEEAPRPSETLPQFNVDTDAQSGAPVDDDVHAGSPAADVSSARHARIDEMRSMSKRVSDWHHSLRAVLLKSQARNCFDIHELGTHIIEAVKSRGSGVVESTLSTTFEDVLAGRDPCSIANYFLSMLQLVSVAFGKSDSLQFWMHVIFPFFSRPPSGERGKHQPHRCARENHPGL